MKQISTIPTPENVMLTQFANILDIEDAKPLTKPSIIAEGGLQQIGVTKLKPENAEKFLLVHPLVPRGIEVRANRMVSRGYTVNPANKSQRSKRAAKEMSDLLDNSGGVLLVKNWIQNTYGFGNGYLTLVPNKADNKIVLLRQEHPIFFRIARHKIDQQTAKQKQRAIDMGLYTPDMVDDFYYGYGANKIDPITKRPAAYTQVDYYDQSKTFIKPIGSELTPDQVAHLVFDTWGDEVDGLSVLQYIHPLVNYMLNAEESSAEALFRVGFSRLKITTDIMTEKDLREMSKNAKDLTTKDVLILPKGVDATNLIPGDSQFPEIHDKFMTLVAIKLGIPKPIITLDGTDTNKATMDELTKDMMNDLRADELKVKKAIEDQIFRPACQKIFGEEFQDLPIFDFNPFRESEDATAARNFRIAQTLDSIGKAATAFANLGFNDMAESTVKFARRTILSESKHGFEEETKNEPEKRDTPIQTTPTTVQGKASETTNTVGRPEGSDRVNVRGEKPPKLPN